MAQPFFRYSTGRDAYVLRGIGGAVGPVLIERRHMTARVSAADAAAELLAVGSGVTAEVETKVPVA